MIAFSSQHDFLFKAIGKEADDLNLPCYVVGGWVRDQLLKRPNSKDIDFVVVGDALDVAKRCSKTLGGSKVTLFKKFGTAQFRWKDWDIEFVQARTESYTSDSRNPAVAPGTLRDDQLRRDFTINAMAMGVNQDNFGQLLDPFDGQSDLKKGIIRTPLNPQETFDDDPLRMMRAVRFASQLGFTIDDQTLKGIQDKANRMAILSSDRIHVELNKIMESKVPSVGLTWMHKGGLMPHVLPEIAALEGVDEVDGHLHKDNFWHSLEVLDNLARVSDK
ncbi:MAG: CCA tRNA nucleotidyltransferase, partial [Schleiferiaceae bacterium]|nr:CCA tRNA nucleotidyltransferase [Schleiferiaceae bacterium]